MEERAFRPRVDGEPVVPVVGTMNFGKRTDEAEARRILDRAWERGVRLFDTANVYVDGVSEEIVGRALKGRDGARIATKVGAKRVGGKVEGLSSARLASAVDESRTRLGLDAIDLYYLHVPDPATPLDDTLDGVSELLAHRKIRRLGVSNYASWQILEIDLGCDARKIARPAVAQMMYNVLIRQLDLEYFAFARAHPIHTTIYNPLAGGLLAGTQAHDRPRPGSRFDGNKMYLGRYWSEAMFHAVERYRALAATVGRTLLELAYGFVAASRTIDSVILGPASLAHLDAALDALDKPLDGDTMRAVDELHRALTGTDARYAR